MLIKDWCLRRTARLRSLANELNLDLVVLVDAKSIYYFTGFLQQSYGWLMYRVESFLCFNDGRTRLFCSQSVGEAAQKAVVDKVIMYQDYNIHETTETYLEDALRVVSRDIRSENSSVARIGVVKRYTPIAVTDSLKTIYPDAQWIDLSEALLSMRRRKDDDELQLLSRAAELSGFCYEVAARSISAGKTEADVYAVCNGAYAGKIGTYVTFSGDFISGERTLKFGGPPTDKILNEGETMIVDLWIEPDGYWADSARSFVVGNKPNKEQNRIYDLVIKAIEHGAKYLKPGVKSRDVYYEVRKVFENVGLSEYFPLHAGHGLGLSPHESPLLIPGSEDTLEAGMVCTLEPGLYIPEIGGIRCEDIFVVRENGPERLSNFERKIHWS